MAWPGNRTYFAYLAICFLTAVSWGDQLPSLIDLTMPPGEEGTRVLRIRSLSSEEIHLPHDNYRSSPQTMGYGDVNGDGFDDLVIAAVGYRSEDDVEGVVVIWGTDEAPNEIPMSLSSPQGFTNLIVGEAGGMQGSIACGDFDGDGFDDILLGLGDTPDVDPFDAPGQAYLFWGMSEWEEGALDLSDAGFPVEVTHFLSGIDGAMLGYSVAAGDFNADGIDDPIIAAPRTDLGDSRGLAGAVHVVRGSADLRGETIALFLAPNPHVLTRVEGRKNGSGLGQSCATGDVNGDGFDDLVLGAPLVGTTKYSNWDGEVTVIYGEATPPSVIELSQPAGTWGETRIHPTERTQHFGTSVACDDMDADGFDEVIGGMPGDYLNTALGPGEVDVVWGGADLPGQEIFVGPDFADRLTTVHGVDSEDRLGDAVACGDIDGDGRADLMAAAPVAGVPLERGRGALYALHAHSELRGTAVDFAHRDPDVSLIGTWPADYDDYFGHGAMAGGDFDRDGVGDFAAAGTVSYVAMVYGVASAETAFANEYFRAGAAPRRGIGGRLSPTVGTWVSFGGGAAPGGLPSIVTAVVISGDAEISNLGTATPDLIADALRWVGSTRTNYSAAEVTFQYTDREIAGLDESTLLLWRSAAREGPWAIVPHQSVDTHRNEIRADDDGQFGFFAITGSLVPPDPEAILAYLLGQTTNPSGLNINGDGGVDVGDLVWALNIAQTSGL